MDFILEWIGIIIGCFIFGVILIGIPVALLRWLWRKGSKK